MRRRFKDDRGQVFTMEGVVSALIMVVALSYILSSVTLISPQTEKSLSTKLSIEAQDTLNLLSSETKPAIHMSDLKEDLAEWNGGEANPAIGAEVNPAEPKIWDLDQEIKLMLPANVEYNMNVTYYDDVTNQYQVKTLIYQGDPLENSGSASKIVVLSPNDGTKQSLWWKPLVTDPFRTKTIEVQLVVWSI